jgi:hypothetical protein
LGAALIAARPLFHAKGFLMSRLLLLAALMASPTQAASPRSEAALLAAEDALFAADVTHDPAAVERGFATEALFIHANGMAETKADYLAGMKSAKPAPKAVYAQNRKLRIAGDLGVISGTKFVELGDLHLSGTYLSVYVFRDKHWQLLNQQSSPAYKAPTR